MKTKRELLCKVWDAIYRLRDAYTLPEDLAQSLIECQNKLDREILVETRLARRDE